jgi:hypothetical protein
MVIGILNVVSQRTYNSSMSGRDRASTGPQRRQTKDGEHSQYTVIARPTNGT